MKKVCIINAYGDKNIGDAAILNVAIKFIKEAYQNNCEISVMCENKKAFSAFIDSSKNIKSFQLPYGYAIRGKQNKVNTFMKVVRFVEIFVFTYKHLFWAQFLGRPLPKKGFYSYITEIKNADIVIGMGGGYLITNDKLRDYFGLLLTLLPVYISKFYKKSILFLPMSFGPFASSHHEQLAYSGLKNTTVISRDQITLKQLKEKDRERRIKTFYAPDMALFFKSKGISLKKKLHSKYIVLTAREWFQDKEKQRRYENSLSSFIDMIWQKHGLHTFFVPMARNIIEDDDHRVAKRIVRRLINKKTFSVIEPKSLEDLQEILGLSRLAICTRMHSAILSTTVQTPFIAIGYGHKTLGFVRSFGIEKWHIDIGDVEYKNLVITFEELLKKTNYMEFIESIVSKQKTINNFKDKIKSEIVRTGNLQT